MPESSGNQRAAGGAQLTDAQAMSLIKEAMTQIQDTYVPYSSPLTENQRRHLLRTGLKNHGFIEEVVRFVTENPSYVPGYVGGEKFTADYTDYKNRRALYDQSKQISRGMEDGLLVSSDACLRDAYAIYDYLKEAARRGDVAAEVAYNALKSRFEDQGPKKQTENV